jgi:cytochrome c oxidase cbb3-type subunit 3
MSSADEHAPQLDSVTGMMTTGHAWDGIQELNTPLPKWWLWIFYATIVWALGYYVFYPSWPLAQSYTRGIWDWSSRADVNRDVADLKQLRQANNDKLAAMPVADVIKNPEMLSFAQAQGKAAFGDNCAPCHGAGGGGAVGYPSLTDDDWLWGGTPDKIHETITVGVRSTDKDTRSGSMTPLSGIEKPDAAGAVAGKAVFAENCVACHGEDAKGNLDLGAPNLTDKIWLYGSDKAAIEYAVTHGRGGVMPTWKGRLDDATIKSLAVYVYTLGGGQK